MEDKTNKYVALYRLSKIDYSNYKGLDYDQRRRVEDDYVSQGLIAQKDIVARYVKNNGGEIIAEYKEIISGRRKKFDEEGTFNKVMRTCISKRADLVISTVDRLARNATFALKVYDELEQHGLKIVVADFPQLDRMWFIMLSAFAEYEWRKCSERQRAAAEVRRKYGSRTGRPVGNPDFSTKKGRKKLAPKLIATGQRKQREWNTNPVVRMAFGFIYNLKNNGYNNYQIADELNKHGYRTTTGKEYKEWNIRLIWGRKDAIMECAQHQELYN